MTNILQKKMQFRNRQMQLRVFKKKEIAFDK